MGWFDSVVQSSGLGALAGGAAGASFGGLLSGASSFAGANGGLSGLLDPITGASATRDAIGAQTAAINQANQIQGDIYKNNQQIEQPWQQAGLSGLSQLQTAMPDLTRQFGAADYQKSPGYDFQLQQGLNAIQKSAAAKGGLNSGATLKALQGYGQGLANQDYQQAYNNFTNNQQQRFGMLSGLANYGQEANRQLSGAGQNYANAMSQNLSSLGNAQAAAYIGQANRTSGLIGQGIGAAGMAYGRAG